LFIKRGNAYIELEKFGAAIEDFSAAIKLQNNEAEWFFDRGYLYLETKEYANAKYDFEKALALNYSEKEMLYYNLGLAYANLGDVDAACKAFALCGNQAEEFYKKYCK
jgi:Flp pilus assembly protein TadD